MFSEWINNFYDRDDKTHAHAQEKKKARGEKNRWWWITLTTSKRGERVPYRLRLEDCEWSFIRAISGVYNTIGSFRFGAATVSTTTTSSGTTFQGFYTRRCQGENLSRAHWKCIFPPPSYFFFFSVGGIRWKHINIREIYHKSCARFELFFFK